MLSMAEKTLLLGLNNAFAISLIASLILGAWTSEVAKLVINPSVDKDIYEPAGKPFNISCQGVGGDESKFSYMEWLNPKGNVVPDGIPGVVKGDKNLLLLTFTSPQIKDSGTYKCTAMYDSQQALERSVDIEFYGLKPQFRHTFENLTVVEKDRVKLQCFAQGDTPITYEWYSKDEDKVPEDANLPIYVSNSRNWSTLIIEEVNEQDGGIYTCTASNTHGLVSKVYMLNVLSSNAPRPEFELSFEEVNATEGETAQLDCIAAEGEKPIAYNWYDEEENKISDDSSKRIFFKNLDDGSALVIEKVTMDDGGRMYVCMASNKHGLVSKVYKLTVFSSSGNDSVSGIREAKIVNVSATSVVFSISGAASSLSYIEVKYKESRDSNETKKGLCPISSNMYSIDGLIPAGLYSFYFRASEKDEWSRNYSVTLLPDTPEIILQSLGQNMFKLQWYRKFDDIMRKTVDFHEIKYFTLGIERGEKWVPRDCATTIRVPSCNGYSYEISGLSSNVYYQIELRAHTASGYGEPFQQKIYMPRL